MKNEQLSADGTTCVDERKTLEEPQVIEEIVIEELSIDGVCGVY